MHWCSGHLFSACHTNLNKCRLTRVCAPVQQRSNFFIMNIFANFVESWKLCSNRRQTKNIYFKHNDALSEPNIQRRAYWFNTQTVCVAPACCCHWTSCIHPRVPSSRPRNRQNSRQLMMQSQLRCCTSIIWSSILVLAPCSGHRLWLALAAW